MPVSHISALDCRSLSLDELKFTFESVFQYFVVPAPSSGLEFFVLVLQSEYLALVHKRNTHDSHKVRIHMVLQRFHHLLLKERTLLHLPVFTIL